MQASWPTLAEKRAAKLRAEAAHTRVRAWVWWLGALIILALTLAFLAPERRIYGLIGAMFPAMNGLRLFTIAQDLLDDSLEEIDL